MDYEEALDFLFSQLPMYQRLGPAAYKPDLGNITALSQLTDHPHERLFCVHIAGTNGKGSTSHMIASVLQASGLKTGLFTSPHLKDFRERIRINGEKISREAVVEFVERFHASWTEIKPSFFEITTAMAFWYFEKERVDVAVIETGLGGRLDSTNIISPGLSVITNVTMDHMDFLGDSIDSIAAEKAGIIKPGIPVVLGKMNPAAKRVITETAAAKGSPIFDSQTVGHPLPETDLLGHFQIENRQTAIKAIEVLRDLGYDISEESLRAGLASVKQSTGLLGRWQVLRETPLIVADCAHNEAGMEAAMNELFSQKFDHLHIVLGMVSDKDISRVLSKLPAQAASYYFCKANIPRGMDAEALLSAAAEFGLTGEAYGSVAKAYEAARLYGSKEDAIFIGGSVFTVAEVL
jgi:dihydrofolate synthase / folylpolyglutamate synthase